MVRTLRVERRGTSWAVTQGRRILSNHFNQQDAIDAAKGMAIKLGGRVSWTDRLGETWTSSAVKESWFSSLFLAGRREIARLATRRPRSADPTLV